MKKILGLLLIGFMGTGYAQDTTKMKMTPVNKEKSVQSGGGAVVPRFGIRKDVATANGTANLKGNYIVERLEVQINSSDAKESMKVVGNPLVIDEVNILGEDMDTITYSVYESQLMNIEDYLFRIFGEVPSTIPADLPTTIMVHKTDNLDCYGIAELRDGLILIPYNGLLLYLRKY